jgi:hypothetical protein
MSAGPVMYNPHPVRAESLQRESLGWSEAKAQERRHNNL